MSKKYVFEIDAGDVIKLDGKTMFVHNYDLITRSDYRLVTVSDRAGQAYIYRLFFEDEVESVDVLATLGSEVR